MLLAPENGRLSMECCRADAAFPLSSCMTQLRQWESCVYSAALHRLRRAHTKFAALIGIDWRLAHAWNTACPDRAKGRSCRDISAQNDRRLFNRADAGLWRRRGDVCAAAQSVAPQHCRAAGRARQILASRVCADVESGRAARRVAES